MGMPDTPNNRKLFSEAACLYKIAFASAERKCSGAKVRYISQFSFLWGALGTAGYDKGFWSGVCAGLSIEWIKANIDGRNYVEELYEHQLKVWGFNISGPNNEETDIQPMSQKVQKSHESQNNLDRALSGYSKEVSEVKVAYPYSNLSGCIKSGFYYYISSGAHAIAAYSSKGRVHFYDPNVGEMSDATITAFRSYLQEITEASFKAQNKSEQETREGLSKKKLTIHKMQSIKA
ncbi:YopT-type cysteine protease domain-containing protein [Vibrio sp. Of7-15]|uniref:YopT-type cysteine protease domain-containing protein n=1 Tax=Vibrio sp. Of7-15 TaxID=2724879 RepID=UPI001EF35846|nr:YopT-type cysteine protease domain-containing protein [Vibrio sp. Of7-15]MCG7495588.1 YopT-type cysteine protease domain-containing protein [Vibrio sp. Of7-15]